MWYPRAVAFAVLALCGGVANAQWYGSADYLLMNRSDNSSTVFQRNIGRTLTTETLNDTTVVISGGTTTTITTPVTRVETEELTVTDAGALDANDIDFDYASAGRVTLGRDFGGYLVEGSLLFSETWQSSGFLESPIGRLAAPSIASGTLVQRTVSTQDIRGPAPFPAPTVVVSTPVTNGINTLGSVPKLPFQEIS